MPTGKKPAPIGKHRNSRRRAEYLRPPPPKQTPNPPLTAASGERFTFRDSLLKLNHNAPDLIEARIAEHLGRIEKRIAHRKAKSHTANVALQNLTLNPTNDDILPNNPS